MNLDLPLGKFDPTNISLVAIMETSLDSYFIKVFFDEILPGLKRMGYGTSYVKGDFLGASSQFVHSNLRLLQPNYILFPIDSTDGFQERSPREISRLVYEGVACLHYAPLFLLDKSHEFFNGNDESPFAIYKGDVYINGLESVSSETYLFHIDRKIRKIEAAKFAAFRN